MVSPIRPMLGIVIAVVFVGCSKKPTTPTSGETAPVLVTVGKPTPKTITTTIEQPGTIQAFEQAPLVAKLPGFVRRVYVDIDDHVVGPERNWWGTQQREGTLLADITIPELDEEVKQKEAMAQQALAEVASSKQQANAAEANHQATKTLIDEAIASERKARAANDAQVVELEKIKRLVSSGVLKDLDLEESRSKQIATQSAWEEAKARIASTHAAEKESKAKADRAKSEIDVAVARQHSAEAEARRVNQLRRYTQIRAPFDGVVTGRFVHTGHFLQPSSGAKAEPLFTVARMDPVRLSVEVPELAAGNIVKGQTKVKVRIQAIPGGEMEAIVARTSWAINPEARTLRVEVDIPNPTGKIRPGMFASASITVEAPKAMVVPPSAVNYQDDLSYCWFAENGVAVRYQVRIGQKNAESIELREKKKAAPGGAWSPISGSEPVIIKHESPLTPDQKIRTE